MKSWICCMCLEKGKKPNCRHCGHPKCEQCTATPPGYTNLQPTISCKLDKKYADAVAAEAAGLGMKISDILRGIIYSWYDDRARRLRSRKVSIQQKEAR